MGLESFSSPNVSVVLWLQALMEVLSFSCCPQSGSCCPWGLSPHSSGGDRTMLCPSPAGESPVPAVAWGAAPSPPAQEEPAPLCILMSELTFCCLENKSCSWAN